MKYVINNCDNYTDFDKDWTCRSTIQNRKGCYCCKDITDCVMKQIVELCKEEWDLRPDMNIDDNFPKEILQLLEIEECENE